MASIFLSHSSRDKTLAKRIAKGLSDLGLNVWLDEWEILVGESITQRIQHGLKTSDFVAVLLTHHSVESGWVEKEWQSRIGEEAEAKKVVILPIRADDCELPMMFRDKKYADFTRDHDEALNTLADSVKKLKDRNATQFASDRSEKERSRLTQLLNRKRKRLNSVDEDIRGQRLTHGVKYSEPLRRLEKQRDKLTEEINTVQRRIEIWEADKNLLPVPNSGQKGPRYVTEGGRHSIFFAVTNARDGESWLLSSFSLDVLGYGALQSGAEDRVNLAELVESLDGVQRNLIAGKISCMDAACPGRRDLVLEKVIRIDPGDIVPFSLPLCCEWQIQEASLAVRLNLIGHDSTKTLWSDCVYLLSKPSPYSNNMDVIGTRPLDSETRQMLEMRPTIENARPG